MSFFTRWLPVFVWGGVIFTLSSLPSLTVSEVKWWDFFLHKTAHVIEYAILFLLLHRATKHPWISLGIVMLYGISDEFHQSFVFGRESRYVRDVFFDTLGGILAWIFLLKLLPKLPPKQQRWLENLLTV
ncbi:MAG: VanZ family protein [bacterium]|nr:VanZ family protein [bacterium]